MSFLWPYALVSIVVVAALAVVYMRAVRRSAIATTPLGPLRSVDGQAVTANPRWTRHIPIGVLLLALTVLAVGAARPVAVLDIPRFEGTVILAFDTSGSMNADDVEATRLEAAKSLATEFVEEQASGVRIGVATFSSGGVVVQTPSLDQDLVIDAIDSITAEGFTSLGQGLFASLDALDEAPIRLDGGDGDEAPVDSGAPIDPEGVDIGFFPSAVIVVLSDGENTNEPDPMDLATIASNAGVRVFTVGVGTPEGAVVEVDGFSLATALNDEVLRAVAERTDGEYIEGPGQADGIDLTELYDRVDRQLEVRGEETELTAIFAGVGALLLLVGAALSMRRFGRAP